MKKTISIVIPTYNGGGNLISIINALLHQKGESFILTEVVVRSDNSSDNTSELIKEISDSRVTYIDSKERLGFGGSLRHLLSTASGEIVVALNDDIKIIDDLFIEKLIQPFLKETNVGLVSGKPTPLPPISFIDKAITSTYNAYQRMISSLPSKNHKYACDGKILVLSREFIKELSFPEDIRKAGNADVYIYFSCIASGFKFIHVDEAVVYYRNATTWNDYIRWSSRNVSNAYLLEEVFGKNLVEREYAIPAHIFWRAIIRESIKNPFGMGAMFLAKVFIKHKAKKISRNFNPQWDLVETTKKLD